jgi:hypothetical protein
MQTSFLLNQFLNQSPMLLVYIGGIVWAALWARRAPTAALLALIGLTIMLASTIGMTFFQNYMFNNRGGMTMTSYGQVLTWVSLAASVFRAVGMAMVVAGVFVGRTPVEARVSGFDVRPGGPPTAPPNYR